MVDEKLSCEWHVHFMENQSQMPINLSKSISGTFMAPCVGFIVCFQEERGG